MKARKPSINTHPWMIKHKRGGATYLTSQRHACAEIARLGGQLYLRTTSGAVKRACARL